MQLVDYLHRFAVADAHRRGREHLDAALHVEPGSDALEDPALSAPQLVNVAAPLNVSV